MSKNTPTEKNSRNRLLFPSKNELFQFKALG